MIVISRAKGQELVIGDNIVISIVEIREDKVRLGIDAPRHVPVHRREVYDTIQRYSDPEQIAPSAGDDPAT